MELSIGILCGGRSRRMGTDKALLPWQSTTFLGRLVQELEGVGEILLSARADQDYGPGNIRCLEDENQDIGPIEGIRKILKEAATEYVFICAVDMPYVNRQTVACIESFLHNDFDGYVLCDDSGLHPLCGIYSKRMLPALEAQITTGDYKIQNVFSKTRVMAIPVSLCGLSDYVVRNVNTEKQYLGLM